MVKRLRLFMTTIGIGFVLLGSAVSTVAAEEFFKGKTIRFVVGFSPGGGFDTFTRLIARHIGKHIPGNPSTLVENRTGAASLIAANYIYNKAKPDGLAIGNFIGPLVLQQVMGNKAAKFDGRKFRWIGAPMRDHTACAFTRASGITSMDKWFASRRPVKMAATGPGSNTSDPLKVLKEMLGLPTQVIDGYEGTSKMLLAMESGEVDGGCWTWQIMRTMLHNQLETGSVRMVLQMMPNPHPELKDVPLAIDYAKTDLARELIRVVAHDQGIAMRPYSLPPGTLNDRKAILTKAFKETLKDPAFLAEAKKAKLEINPVDGQELKRIFDGLYKMKPATLARLKKIVLPKR